MFIKISFLTVVLFFATVFSAVCQAEWELSKDEDGIKVYTGKLNDSKFKSVRVECTLEGTPDKLITILKNVNNNNHWVYNTKRTFLVRNVSNNEFIYYAETSLPWPLRNRDVVINMLFSTDSAGKLTIKATGVKNETPEQDGIVRLSSFDGLWEVISTDSNHINIRYQLSVNPGGSIPGWAYNMFVAKGPYKTFSNLAALLKK
ncbi:MAG: START domain-containing protein [Ferruginibacter sp.]